MANDDANAGPPEDSFLQINQEASSFPSNENPESPDDTVATDDSGITSQNTVSDPQLGMIASAEVNQVDDPKVADSELFGPSKD